MVYPTNVHLRQIIWGHNIRAGDIFIIAAAAKKLPRCFCTPHAIKNKITKLICPIMMQSPIGVHKAKRHASGMDATFNQLRSSINNPATII